MVAHACNSVILREVDERGPWVWGQPGATQGVQNQLELHSETLFQQANMFHILKQIWNLEKEFRLETLKMCKADGPGLHKEALWVWAGEAVSRPWSPVLSSLASLSHGLWPGNISQGTPFLSTNGFRSECFITAAERQQNITHTRLKGKLSRVYGTLWRAKHLPGARYTWAEF